MNNKASILSTASLDQPLIDRAVADGVAVDVMSFIRVEHIVDEELQEEITELAGLPITAVFTSANAVRSISDIIKGCRLDWDIYCVGNATKNAVFELLDTDVVSGIGNDAAELAELIIADDIMEVVFFCGDKRMDTLPELLREEEVTVYEVVVYQTTETPQIASRGYDGILFFSPSGVASFFKVNTIGPATVLFAIGKTTGEAIKQHSDNKLIISETPSKENVVADAVEYFHTQAVTTMPGNNIKQ